MAGGIDLRITLTSNALDQLDEKTIGQAVTAGLEAAAVQFKKEVAEGFNKEATPGGSGWKPLSPLYARLKARMGGGSILVLTGAMKKAAESAPVEISGNGSTQIATLTATDPKSSIHEYGAGKIPARPFFTVEGQAAAEVIEAGQKGFIAGLKDVE